MAKFLSKFVNKNNPSLSPDNDGRQRTISDVGPVRSRTVSAVNTTGIPSLTLTSDNGDSPVLPSTPGSLHRTNSKGSGGRNRAETLSTVKSSLPGSPVPSTPSRADTSLPYINTPSSTAVTGLGIDLEGSTESTQSTVVPDTASISSSGGLGKLRHKLSSKSLKGQPAKPSPLKPHEPLPNPPQPQAPNGVQEVEMPSRTQSMELVDSPKSTEGNDNTPTTASFASTPGPIETGSMIDATAAGVVSPAAAALSPATSSMSAKSGLSTQSSLPDSDAISIASTNTNSKRRPWRTSSASKKRKPTGLASAIASSGLAMASPGVQSLQSFVPPPTMSPPRSSFQAGEKPKRSFSGGRPKSASNASRTRVNGMNGLVSEDGLYDDDEGSESEDGLDLDDVPVTGFAVASNKRNQEFHDMFQSVPEGDYLIEDYGCALQREILIQGRLYISENHICFHANIFGWVTDLIIPVQEIQDIKKQTTALFIPNAIGITTRTAKYTFASFLSRDTTHDVIHNVWNLSRPDTESILSVSSVPLNGQIDPSLVSPGSAGTEASAGGRSPLVRGPSSCECSLNSSHYSNVCMTAVLPGTPEKIYNLMFTSEFIKDFWRNDQNLKDLQISDWIPDPATKLLSRKFSYIKILNGIVKQTKCEISDTTRHCDFEEYVTMDTSTRTPDVPSGSVFEVKTRTCITWAGPATSKVVVTTQVDWTGRSFIKSMITGASIEGQKAYHKELEAAMRRYIAANKTEFIPEGLDIIEAPASVAEEEARTKELSAICAPLLSTEEASKKRESERNQRATQWAFDTIMGAYKVAKTATIDALDLVSDAWDQSSSTTILYFVIVVLVMTNLATFMGMGRREEVGRRKEMIKMEEQRKWVAGIVAALHEEQEMYHAKEAPKGKASFVDEAVPVPMTGEERKKEIEQLSGVLDAMGERVRKLKQSLDELD